MFGADDRETTRRNAAHCGVRVILTSTEAKSDNRQSARILIDKLRLFTTELQLFQSELVTK